MKLFNVIAAIILFVQGIVFTTSAEANSKTCWLDPVSEMTICADNMGSSNSLPDEKTLQNNFNKGRCWSDGQGNETCSAW